MTTGPSTTSALSPPASLAAAMAYESGYHRVVCVRGAVTECPLTGPGVLSTLRCDKCGAERRAVLTLSGGHACPVGDENVVSAFD